MVIPIPDTSRTAALALAYHLGVQFAEGFMKKYPFIKASYWRADTADTIAKVSAEQRAKSIASRRALVARRDEG